jgi:hypothetical protein
MLGLAFQRRAQLQQLAPWVFATLVAALLMQLTVLIPNAPAAVEASAMRLRILSMVATSGLLLLSFIKI